MKVVYAMQEPPESWAGSLFLAGPTPRSEAPVPSWRPEALTYLEGIGFEGVVFVPETEDGTWLHDYDIQVQWETQMMHMADVVLFWVPRDLKTMPAFTTNVEFGRWVDSQKIVLGHPPRAPKTRYLDALIEEVSQNTEEVYETLEDTLGAALSRLGTGSLRSGGERYVPLHIWNTPMFQSWYASQVAAGNRLEEAQVRWIFRMPKWKTVFSWVLWVKVWIASEGRFKDNEWVFSRKDISTAVLYYSPGEYIGTDAQVVLVREFRSPARTADGMIRELPGGSAHKTKTPLQVISEEVEEETGLSISADRFTEVGSRQVAGTLSSHHAATFCARLTKAELDIALALARSNKAHGVEADTERTYVEVKTFKELLTDPGVDWANLGMVCAALMFR